MKTNFIYLLFCFLLLTSCAPALQKKNDGITLRVNGKTINIIVYDHSVIRIQASPARIIKQEPSLILLNNCKKNVPWTMYQSGDTVSLSTVALIVQISKTTGAITFIDSSGRILLREPVAGAKYFRIDTLLGDDVQTIEQRFNTSDDEALYGMGQHQSRQLNIKGMYLDLFQRNTEVYVPFFMSTKNYGILWHNYSHTRYGDPKMFALIPRNCLSDTAGKLNRITAEYFADKKFTQPVEIKNLVYPSENLLSLPQGYDTSVLSMRLSGYINTKEAGAYRFFFNGSGVFKLWINDSLLIDYWHVFLESTDVGTIMLPGDTTCSFRIEYSRKWKKSVSELRWTPPSALNNDIVLWSQSGKAIDYFFVAGQSADEVIGGYRQLTGTATMMPRWAMGLWQCKERYKSQDEVLSVAAEYRRRGIPLDNIVQDWFYWKEDQWGSHRFDSTRFPDPVAMVDSLHKQNIRIMISVWPKFYPFTTDLGKEMFDKGYLYPKNIQDSIKDWMKGIFTFYDAFNANARALYWQRINERLYSKGFDCWWLDASEPEMTSVQTAYSLAARMTPTALGPGYHYLNAYPLVHCEGVYYGQRAQTPDRRVFILTRSAFAGMQRCASATWSGDVAGRFETFRKQIPAGLSFSAAGMPFWTTDIGGFFLDKNDANNDPEYRELFVRWFQFGAFCPLFRVHGSSAPREMWLFGNEAFAIQLTFDKLRYALMEYIYSLNAMVNRDHYTIMRPLFMDFNDDARTFNITDQYMFGPSIMVCPVTRYLQRSRKVYLPHCDGGWYDLWTGRYAGNGEVIDAPAPLNSMPLFVKAGSIIPYGPDMQYTGEKPADPLMLKIYEGADGSFTLYEDDNLTYGYEKGEYSTIRFYWDDHSKKLTVSDRSGHFKGMIQERRFEVQRSNPLTPKGYLSYPEPLVAEKYTGKKMVLVGK